MDWLLQVQRPSCIYLVDTKGRNPTGDKGIKQTPLRKFSKSLNDRY
jgi:hypothetical protein